VKVNNKIDKAQDLEYNRCQMLFRTRERRWTEVSTSGSVDDLFRSPRTLILKVWYIYIYIYTYMYIYISESDTYIYIYTYMYIYIYQNAQITMLTHLNCSLLLINYFMCTLFDYNHIPIDSYATDDWGNSQYTQHDTKHIKYIAVFQLHSHLIVIFHIVR
jgi:hypothetical protein